MKRTLGALALAAALVGGVSSEARADFDLRGFGAFNSDTDVLELDVVGFENFVGDLGMALHPKFAGPGATVGGLGIDLGVQIAISDIDETSDHWQKASGNRTPDGALNMSSFYVRKGLPYSFELGGILTTLHDSDLWAVALELKWAWIEGNKYAPDFGVRSHVNTVLGSRDFIMITSGVDFVVSKAFGIAGLVQLTPFAGYELSYIHARSQVLGVFREGNVSPETFILPNQDLLRHRGLLGFKVVAGIADFGFEMGLGEVLGYTFRIGLNL